MMPSMTAAPAVRAPRRACPWRARSRRRGLPARRHAVRQKRVARWPAAAAADPSQCAQQEHPRPAVREGVSKSGQRGGQIAGDAGGLPPTRTISDETACKLGKAGEAVGDTLDDAEGHRRRAETGQKTRQYPEVAASCPQSEKKTGEADAEDSAREPASRVRGMESVWLIGRAAGMWPEIHRRLEVTGRGRKVRRQMRRSAALLAAEMKQRRDRIVQTMSWGDPTVSLARVTVEGASTEKSGRAWRCWLLWGTEIRRRWRPPWRRKLRTCGSSTMGEGKMEPHRCSTPKAAVLAVSQFDAVRRRARATPAELLLQAAPAEFGKTAGVRGAGNRVFSPLGVRVETGVFQAHMEVELVKIRRPGDHPARILTKFSPTPFRSWLGERT